MNKNKKGEINIKLIVNNNETPEVLIKTEEMENIDKMNKTELLNLCKELGITKCSSKNKSQLVELISSKQISLKTLNDALSGKEENTIISTGSPVSLTKHLKPLIKWSGGKSDEIKQFEKYLPSEYNVYIEPFIGGGSLYFHLAPKKAVISDVHIELVDFYRSIGEGKAKEIYEFMKTSPNDEDTYYKIRDKMEIKDALDNAKRFYYQRKTCFRGMMRYNKNGKFNIPFGRYKTINFSDIQNKDYEDLLSRTDVLNKSFEYVFENYNDANNFMFLDPPYDSEFTDYGYCQFGKEEQKKLATLFKETKIKCLMVIGKTKFIEELYKDYIVDEYEKKYKFKLYAGRVGDEINTKHLVIKNY
jgi:DNA adenine methylase